MKSLVPTEPDFDRKVEEQFVNADTTLPSQAFPPSQLSSQTQQTQMRMRGELSDEEMEHSFGGEMLNINGKRPEIFVWCHIIYIGLDCLLTNLSLKFSNRDKLPAGFPDELVSLNVAFMKS